MRTLYKIGMWFYKHHMWRPFGNACAMLFGWILFAKTARLMKKDRGTIDISLEALGKYASIVLYNCNFIPEEKKANFIRTMLES